MVKQADLRNWRKTALCLSGGSLADEDTSRNGICLWASGPHLSLSAMETNAHERAMMVVCAAQF